MISKNKYTADIKDGRLEFYKEDALFISLPLAVSVNGDASKISGIRKTDNGVTLFGECEEMNVRFFDECVTLSYKKSFSEPTPIYEVRAFAGGIAFPDFDRAFTPQARNNSHRNLDFFSHLPDISSNGYFTPPLLEFSIGSKCGWVSFGLLDIPDTKLCRLTEDMDFLVQSSGGNVVCTEYVMPEIAVFFSGDEWEAISDFRELLIKFGKYTPEKKKYSELPDWWKKPLVCIYGDQLIDECVGQAIDEAWVEGIVNCAEEDWGMHDFNLVIDDSWQLSHSMTPVVDEKRFPDLRGFIERMHARGHRVLLWMTPLMDKITNGFKTKSEKLGVVTDYECPSPYYKDFPGTYFIDYTADNARQFIKETVGFLFGKGIGELGADGVKLDFLANHRDPALPESHYAHPERGIGMREMYLFYETFYEEAKRVNPDVIIDATVGDPRFEKFVDYNRMHDTHSGNIEKDLRVRVSTLACPDLTVDSDGALMFKAWLKPHYIDAAVYGIPANYYTRLYQDYRMRPEDFENVGARTPEPYETLCLAEKKQLGALFEMVKHRPDGSPKYTGHGWALYDGDETVAESFFGSTVVYYPTEKNKKGYLFTFRDEAIEIPLYGRHFGKLDGGRVLNGNVQVDYARDRVILHVEPGRLYSFEDVDEENSTDRFFSFGSTATAEEDTDYVN